MQQGSAGRQCLHNSASDLGGCLVLPEPKDGPSVFEQQCGDPLIPSPIPGDLRGPKIGIAFGYCVVFGASVPEASIYEDRYPGTGEHQIRPQASVIWQRRVVNPVAESCCVSQPADSQFGLSVPSPVRDHARPHPGA